MKFTIKTSLALAGGLLLTAQANAAIDNVHSGTFSFGGGAAGELFLSVVDRNSAVKRSYTRDLDLSTAAWNGSNFSLAADSNLLDIINNAAAGVSWHIAGGDNTATPANGIFTTASTALSASAGGPNSANSAALNNIQLHTDNVNATGSFTGPTSSRIFTSITNGGGHDESIWGNTWTTRTTFGTEGSLDEGLSFYRFATDLNDPESGQTIVSSYDSQGVWTLASNGLLTFGTAGGGNPAPVPVPAAVWLLGSALVGLVGVSRRRETGV